MIQRRHFAHTVSRSRRVDIGPLRILEHRHPISEPYAIGFDQHDPRNYVPAEYVVRIGRLSIHWRLTDD